MVTLSPLLYLLSNTDWIYPELTSTDSYWNQAFSYFYDIPHFKNSSYKASRVPWLSLLFYLQKITGPYALTIVVVVGSLLTQIILYYHLARLAFGRAVAFNALPWIAFFPHFTGMNTGGGTYQTPGAAIYLLMALICWLYFFKNRKTFYLLLTGFFFASSFYTQIIYAHLIPIFLIFEINKMGKIKLKNSLYVFAGGLIATGFWGFINWIHGRPFYFFKEMIDATFQLVGSPENQSLWWKPLDSLFWLQMGRGPQLMIHFVLTTFGIIFFVSKTKSIKLSLPQTLSLNYIILVLLWVIYQLGGQAALNTPDFVYTLQIPAFLMVVSWFSRKAHPVPLGQFFIQSLLLFISISFSVLMRSQITSGEYSHTIIISLLLFASFGFFFFLRNYRSIYFVSILALIISYGLFSNQLRFKSNHYCNSKEQAHDVIISIVEKLKTFESDPQKIFFYGKSGIVTPIHGCPNNHPIRTEKIMENAMLITAHFIDYKSNPPIPLNELTAKNLWEFNRVEKTLVVFNFDDSNFSENTKEKIKAMGYNVTLKSVESFKLFEHNFNYHILGVLRNSSQ